MKKKHIVILLGIVVLISVIILSSIIFGIRISNGLIYSRSDSYNHLEPGMGGCAAIMPACGVCQEDDKEGFVENKVCYIPL